MACRTSPSDEAAYTLTAHIENLEALVLALDLKNITLVMQDWGGPIGLGLAARHPDRIRGLVILNTFGFYPPMDGVDPEKLKLPPPLLLMRSRGGLVTVIVRRIGFFERQVMTDRDGHQARRQDTPRLHRHFSPHLPRGLVSWPSRA